MSRLPTPNDELCGSSAATLAEEMTPDSMSASNRNSAKTDVELVPVKPEQDAAATDSSFPDWDNDAENPMNWPARKKAVQFVVLASCMLMVSMATSLISPAHEIFMLEFGVSSTVAILPLTLYVVALGFGPVIGGPVSETLGRYPVFAVGVPVGALLSLGVGFCHNFGAICFLRFLAGLVWGPILAVTVGCITDLWSTERRGPVSAILVLMAFFGPGVGPVIGAFLVSRKSWRWTQWTLCLFALWCIIWIALTSETFHPVVKRRLAKKRGITLSAADAHQPRFLESLAGATARPLRMLFGEPIVAFISLYVAAEFGTLFCFFAAVPYTFTIVYFFTLEHYGLVFISIVIGCVLAAVVVVLCDVLLYRRQLARFPKNQVPPEYRLYPAMIGSLGMPIGLFWFGWSAKASISWASPACAIIPFAMGNLCLFISTMQYLADTYHGSVVASAAAANGLARYGFAGIFPLFTLQMYEKLGINWASSLLGFVALALLPVPWVLFKYGPQIRDRSAFTKIGRE